MPTTRSQGRSEPLQRLETPPKRQRKQRVIRPRITQEIPQDPPMRTLSMSPEQKQLPSPPTTRNPSFLLCSPKAAPARNIVTYHNASTQTEEVVVLTRAEAAELRERASESMSHKRTRDDESEEEPAAKRHQFSTPQNNKPNDLWMFGPRANGDYPRTAPSKSAVGSAHRRTARAPLTRRTNLYDSPRSRNKPTTPASFDSIKPIEQITTNLNTEEQEETPKETAGTQQYHQQQTQPTAPPETPRRGLFGSLRGMMHRGWDLAASLTPRGSRTEPAPTAQQGNIQYPQLSNVAEEPHGSPQTANAGASQQASNDPVPAERYTSRYGRPNPDYDHLHYIPADADSIDKAISGEILPPPRPPTPPSPASRIRAQNPQLSESTIQLILKRRERKAALDAARYGPRPVFELPKVAPLFGPDSHYARGTVDPRFLPTTPLCSPSKKRKLESMNGQIPQPKSGGFGVDDEYLDVDVEVDSVDQNESDQDEVRNRPEVDAPPAKKHRIHESVPATSKFPTTPRSALKKPGITGSVKGKSVVFGTSTSRDIRGHYGPAGQYKGSTFADEHPEDSRSLSSIDHSDVISPNTRSNTLNNSGRKPASVLDNLGAKIPAIDFTLRDPTDPIWRPSLGNPKPGFFRVPFIDEEDPDESTSDASLDNTPEQPQTPRISHAELPAPPSTGGFNSFNESSIMHESTELALDKARSRAEKYKPKSSSRLSEVSRARSRSTSPDAEEDESMSTPKAAATSTPSAPAVMPIGAVRQPFVPPELDNTVKGLDGMTDHEREHQYDEWAANLNWDAPQTYEDAGTGSAFIHNLIRKNWTEEDSRRSESFWAKEFDEVDREMKAAKANGQKLTLITGMEEVESY